jgi:ribosomal protein S18 acetylase RimI-like enzyme
MNHSIVGENHIYFREAFPSDFPEIIKIIESSDNESEKTRSERHPTDLKRQPWSWYGDPLLDWVVGEIEGVIVAFLLTRHIGRNLHIHSFIVKEQYHGKGVAQSLIAKHWEHGLQKYEGIDTLSLHVYQNNIRACRFYEKCDYHEVNQSQFDPQENSGLGDWVQRCLMFNNWPLRKGLKLYVRYAKASY